MASRTTKVVSRDCRRRRRPGLSLQTSGSNLASLLIAVLSAIVLTPKVISMNNNITSASGSSVKVESGPGWAEVGASWPHGDSNYFVATEKGHHFIEVLDLPKNLNEDLIVTLEYYYSYANVKPVLQMTPCSSNLYIIDEDGATTEGGINKWNRYEHRINYKDCIKRNRLTFNVILQDSNDLFAWRSMTVKSVEQPPPPPPPAAATTTTTTTTSTTTSATTTTATTEETPTSTGSSKNGNEDESTKMVDNDANQDSVAKADELNEKTGESEKSATSTESLKLIADSFTEPSQKRPADAQDELASMIDEDVNSISNAIPVNEKGPEEKRPEQKRPEEKKPEEKESEERKSTASVREGDSLMNPSTIDGKQNNKVEVHERDLSVKVAGDKGAREDTGDDEDEDEDDEDDVSDPRRGADYHRIRAKRFADKGKRSKADSKTADKFVRVDERCKPSLCNRQRFHMARFSPLIAGVPPKPATTGAADKTKKYYLNLKNQALKMSLQSVGPNLYDVDSCIKFQLYLDNNAELELLLEQQPSALSNATERLLEVIMYSKTSGGASGGQWGQIERCISNYMPRLSLGEGKSAAEGSSKSLDSDSIRFLLRSRSRLAQRGGGKSQGGASATAAAAAAPGQVAILVDTAPNRGGYLRRLHPVREFLPDTGSLAHESDLSKYWVLDGHAGAKKPKLKLSIDAITPKASAGAATTAAAAAPSKRLIVSEIAPTTDNVFDMTSRWLKIRDSELLEQPVLFVYKTEQADWIDKIEFQFQRAGDSLNQWLSKVVYQAPSARASGSGSGSGDGAGAGGGSYPKVAKDGDGGAFRASSMPWTAVSVPAPGPRFIGMPVKIKGLDSSEFRLRVRHHLRAAPTSGSSSALAASSAAGGAGLGLGLGLGAGRTLTINSLAFADACSYKSDYCKNNGSCNPTGPAQASCVCMAGFSGKFCEHENPCDVLYGPAQQTGHDVCKSIGASCVTTSPVMRCQWSQHDPVGVPHKTDLEGRHIEDSSSGGGGDDSKEAGEGGSRGGTASGSERGAAGRTSVGMVSIDWDKFNQLPPAEQAAMCRNVVNEQSKLVIILGVFIVAVLVFALVLLFSLVSRLRRSSRRLKRSQTEVHELARRIKPGGGGGAGGVGGVNESVVSTSFGRAPAKTVVYNNSAFDVE